MFLYLLILGVLFLQAVIGSWFSLSPLTAVVFMFPVAVYWARGRFARAVGLVAAASAAAGIALASALGAAYYGALAALGIPLGLGIARRLSCGWIVAIVTAVCFALHLAAVVSIWDAWVVDGANFCAAQSQGSASAEEGTEDDVHAVLQQQWEWLGRNWADVSIGALFSVILMGATVAVFGVTYWMRRRLGSVGPPGSFGLMRMPEWLVWLVIVGSAGWFADHYWPQPMVRVVAWNSLVGLASIYWINGLSVVAYTVTAVRSPMTAFFVVAAATLAVYFSPLLSVIGLFDTWADFRRRVDRFVTALKERERSQHDDV